MFRQKRGKRYKIGLNLYQPKNLGNKYDESNPVKFLQRFVTKTACVREK